MALCSLVLAGCGPAAGLFRPIPSPTPTPLADRFAVPPLPDRPTQADHGKQVYYQVCMACHGDRGQGLTQEWRVLWEEDSNCWQSECHGNNHPPQGFSFPRTCCKAVLGKTALLRFDNALDLHQYIRETMPWWNPGYLKPEEYWQITAYLLREQGVLPAGVTLDASNARAYHLHPAQPLAGDVRPAVLLATLVLALAAGTYGISLKLK